MSNVELITGSCQLVKPIKINKMCYKKFKIMNLSENVYNNISFYSILNIYLVFEYCTLNVTEINTIRFYF